VQLLIEELDGDVTKVILDGRMDITGAQNVDLKMNVIAGSKKYVVIDAQKLAFLGSMGLRTIVTVARTVKSRGGKIAMFGANQDVEKVLKMSGVNTLLPIVQDFQSAIALWAFLETFVSLASAQIRATAWACAMCSLEPLSVIALEASTERTARASMATRRFRLPKGWGEVETTGR